MTGDDFPEAFTAVVSSRSVSGSVSGSVPGSVSGSVIVPNLTPANYNLVLGVSANCAVQGENPRLVRVNAGETTAVVFTVTCSVATGTLRVTTRTTGVDLDRDGYGLRVDGYSVTGLPFRQISRININETALLFRVPTTGSTRLTLYGMAVNCDPSDATSRPVSISPGDTAAFTFNVTCTPDTDSVAYVAAVSGIRHIVIVSANGSGLRHLTSDISSDEDPAWSPDGKKIAFTTDRDGNREIYVIDADGSNPRRLTEDRAEDYAPTWSPDGTRIAFVSERDGNAEIYAMNADGTALSRLTTNATIEADPAWSPDGRIAFTSDRNGRTAGNMDVYVMNADGSNPARLTTNGGVHPTWSRDGTLAYAAPDCAQLYCQLSIFVRSVAGTDSPVAFGVADRPSWSPDGRKIAYTALTCDFYYYECVPGGVRIGRLDGTDVITLASSGLHTAWRP